MTVLCLVFSVCIPILVPLVTGFAAQLEPLPLAVLTFCAMIVWMKLISYAMVNADLRCDSASACRKPTTALFVTCKSEPCY